MQKYGLPDEKKGTDVDGRDRDGIDTEDKLFLKLLKENTDA